MAKLPIVSSKEIIRALKRMGFEHAPKRGKYAGLDYVYVPDPFDRKPPIMSSLNYKEVEKCQLEITPHDIPLDGDEIKFDITSREGGIHANSIKIKKHTASSST